MRDVFGVVRISDEPTRQIVGRVEMRQHDQLEARPPDIPNVSSCMLL
jgi:hypothetical protein